MSSLYGSCVRAKSRFRWLFLKLMFINCCYRLMMKGKITLSKIIFFIDNFFRVRSRWCSGCAL